MKKYFAYFQIILILSSCASGYTTINPANIYYQSSSDHGSVSFAYKYEVLNERGNKKYAKKEVKKGIKLVAIKVENHSNEDLVFGKDYVVYSGDRPVNLLESSFIHSQLKQGVPIYLLYLLLTPMQFTSNEESTHIGLVIGPGITLGNMIGAGTANANFKKELENNLLNNREIKSGETVYGLIGIVDNGYNQLTLKNINQ
ncbi:hypothetical protein [Flexithrix dorotheae]|uniref:hypothetical protein n=1 Tax=Flexithrix dorotheae TaxID=70993 RepID=UPI00036D0029|nr:hypothetical protein [Flexithrix dorotheae]